MYVPADIQARIKADVDKYVAIATNHFKRSYMTPKIEYQLRGTTAGRAHGMWKVEFNPILLMENLEDFIARTVPHEVAHCIDTANGGNEMKSWSLKRSVHGPSWKRIMRVFGVDDSTRCHDYDVSNAQTKKKTKFEYKCGCCHQSLFLGPVRHRKQQAYIAMYPGKSRYSCAKCGRQRGGLEYIQNLGKRSYSEAKQVSSARRGFAERLAANIAANNAGVAATPAATKEVPIKNFTESKDWPKIPVPTLFPVVPGQSLVDRARKLYHMYSHLGRRVCIEKMVDIGIKATTASTYYQNFRSGK